MLKKILVLVALLALFFTQCNSPITGILTSRSLQAQYFDIDINKDTVVKTAHGALINIAKGSLSGGNGSTVKLEVKEAYSMSDIVGAGLTTRAGKDPLSSGGMIFINPADGANITINHPLGISLPTNNPRDGMKLFKGKQKPDSSIDWTDPTLLPASQKSPEYTSGEILYKNNCSSCHQPDKNATGPALALLDKRRDWRWLSAFVKNSSATIQKDYWAAQIYCIFNKTAMTAFPQLTDSQLHLIFDYVDKVVADKDPKSIPDFKESLDSCHNYEFEVNELRDVKERLMATNDPEVEIKNFVDSTVKVIKTPAADTSIHLVQGTIVVPAFNRAEYYKFNITEFGWYNVDIILKDTPGFENSNLIVKVSGAYRENLNIYFVLPEKKVLLPGGPAENQADQYAFATTDGKIQLPQGAHAFIFAIGEQNGQLYFGRIDFTTTLLQKPELTVNTISKEDMDAQLKKMEMPDLKVEMSASKNADSLRTIDQLIENCERLKPKMCDCKCFNDFFNLADTGHSESSRK